MPQVWCDMISDVLRRNMLKVGDIDYFIFSQLSDAFNMKMLELLNIPEEKYSFLGREYGYAGNKIIIGTAGARLSYIVQLYTF